MNTTKILAFDSIYMVYPIRAWYLALVKILAQSKKLSQDSLVLYRLDKDNIFIRDVKNLSGITVGTHKDEIELLSIKFHQYLEASGSCSDLQLKKVQLYKLYTRQLKLKLAGVLKCAIRINSLSDQRSSNLDIITDKQSASIIKKALLFLNYHPSNITWRTHRALTVCVTLNSFVMRIFSVFKMAITRSTLPKHYFIKSKDSSSPSVLITMPKRRPEDFYATYVKKLENQYNIVLYSIGKLQPSPPGYKRIAINDTLGVLKGLLNIKTLCFNQESYIADVLLIFRDLKDLGRSIDVVRSVLNQKIDAHISRLQTNVCDNYFAIEAKKKGVYILGDVMEEIFYCDSAICASRLDDTEPLKLATANTSKTVYKGSNSLINYRLKNIDENMQSYLRNLLRVSLHKKIIFYASDPSKEESQRYLTEMFLMRFFANVKTHLLVVKTHPQDRGGITNYAYIDSGQPPEVTLIGDSSQKNVLASNFFKIFDGFNFNAAVSSSDGFLTSSSSSILQALTLGVKTGIVDKFKNGFYDQLVHQKVCMLVQDESSLQEFLISKGTEVSDDILSYCGLQKVVREFDVGNHLMDCLRGQSLENEGLAEVRRDSTNLQ